MTLAEERPDYPERVAAFLAKHGWRRLPWGSIVTGGGLTVTKSRREVQARQEIGEVAITLLGALGVTAEMLDKMADLPHDTAPEVLVCTMQDMRAVAAMIGAAAAPEPAPAVVFAPGLAPKRGHDFDPIVVQGDVVCSVCGVEAGDPHGA